MVQTVPQSTILWWKERWAYLWRSRESLEPKLLPLADDMPRPFRSLVSKSSVNHVLLDDDAWSVTDTYHHSASYVSHTYSCTWLFAHMMTLIHNRYLPSFCFLSVILIPRFLHTWQHLIWNTNWHLPSFFFLCQLHLYLGFFTPDNT